ncbi:hypothetical protein NPIL_200961 [Nephila pilipes]|uniref:Uncharacterized protein n=1 Tax=Nephila pilipes TaxID=299642 RepID=A0A8X6TGS6_NEPPI|nr:hypothetical protein NPIL_200961 [Nephila pilipes]
MRLWTDYCTFNAVTVTYPLPRKNEFHDAIQINLVSTIDLRAGYHRVYVCIQLIKTNLLMLHNLELSVSDFIWLKKFRRLIAHFKSGVPDAESLVHWEDIIVRSPTFKDQMVDFNIVFQRIEQIELIQRHVASFIKK